MSRSSIDGAIDGAIVFLADQRDTRGLWADFDTMAGCSVDWVSGYILVSLAGVPGAWTICQDTVGSLIQRQRRSGGWGYHEHIPEDADSTAWVLRGLLNGRFVPPHATHAASGFLLRHQLATGGFTTFGRPAAIGAVIGEADARALVGWGQTHTCVTGNIAVALLQNGVPATAPALTRALDYLVAQRDTAGLWGSYWWNGPTFGTYHALLALVVTGRYRPGDVGFTARGLLTMRNADGGWGDAPEGGGESHAFATAYAILALLLASDPRSDDAVSDAAEWLLSEQRPDGSWPSVPILRIPDAHVTDPLRPGDRAQRAGTGTVVADQRRCFTAATVVHALHRYRRTVALRRRRPV